MPSSRYNKYSAADMERYHNGSMSTAEMHALEKAALDDPFLSDAIDGYVHAATPAADLAYLKKKIQSRQAKVVPMNRNRRVLLSIAAMLLLFMGFGWLAYQFSNKNEHNIAFEKNATPALKPIPAPINGSSALEKTRNSKEAADQPVITAPLNDAAQTNKPVPGETAARINETTVQSTATDRVQTFSKPHINAARASHKMISARVVNAQNKAVPGAVISDAKKVLTVTDTCGNFSLPNVDSNVAVRVNAAGYQQQLTMLPPTDSVTKIMLQPATTARNEVVIASKQQAARKINRVRLEAVQPLSGWKHFNAYVYEHLTALREVDTTLMNQEVILSFNVDAKGNAKEINVEKSACAACDTTAMHLIQQGGKWRKTSKSNKARAWIHF